MNLDEMEASIRHDPRAPYTDWTLDLLAEVRRLREQVMWLEKERDRFKEELGEDDHSLRFDVEGIDY